MRKVIREMAKLIFFSDFKNVVRVLYMSNFRSY